jgi:hypothetical protein
MDPLRIVLLCKRFLHIINVYMSKMSKAYLNNYFFNYPIYWWNGIRGIVLVHT